MLFLKAGYSLVMSHGATENIQISVASEPQAEEGWRGSDKCKV